MLYEYNKMPMMLGLLFVLCLLKMSSSIRKYLNFKFWSQVASLYPYDGAFLFLIMSSAITQVFELDVNYFQNEAQLLDDGLALHGFSSAPYKFGSSEDDPIDSDDAANAQPRIHPAGVQNSRFNNSKPIMITTGRMKRDLKRRPLANGWIQKRVILTWSQFFIFYIKIIKNKIKKPVTLKCH